MKKQDETNRYIVEFIESQYRLNEAMATGIEQLFFDFEQLDCSCSKLPDWFYDISREMISMDKAVNYIKKTLLGNSK